MEGRWIEFISATRSPHLPRSHRWHPRPFKLHRRPSLVGAPSIHYISRHNQGMLEQTCVSLHARPRQKSRPRAQHTTITNVQRVEVEFPACVDVTDQTRIVYRKRGHQG